LKKIKATIPTSRPFQKVLVAEETAPIDEEDFDFGNE
jgi:hypothetical protein